MSSPVEGGCRCGALRVRLNAAPLLTSACHCTGCQRMSGSPFSLATSLWLRDFEVIAGEPVLGGLRDPRAQHYHCDRCKSWVYTTDDPFVSVRTTMLDAPKRFAPFIETWTREKLPWATTGAVHSYPREPADSDYEGLMSAFAAR